MLVLFVKMTAIKNKWELQKKKKKENTEKTQIDQIRAR